MMRRTITVLWPAVFALLARPAFARWRESFVHLWQARGGDNPFVNNFPQDWDTLVATGATSGAITPPKGTRASIKPI